MRGLKKRFLCMGMIFALAVGPLLGNILVVPVAAENLSMSYYVSLTGNDDSNTGSIDQPFRTVEKARDVIRTLKSADGLPEGGVAVYIRGGIYSLIDSIALNAEDSGEPGKPVVYSAYPGEKVSFMGGYDLDPVDFGPVTDPAVLGRLPDAAEGQILMYDLAAHGITQYGVIPKNGYGWPKTAPAPELFIGDRSMTLARYPNSGYINISSVSETGFIPRDYCSDMPKGDPSNPDYVPSSEWLSKPGPVFKYSDEHLDNWSLESEGWVCGYWNYDWADDNLKIGTVSTLENTITAIYPSFYGCKSGQRFYGYNMLCELDAPGEWYLDRSSGKLYVYPEYSISGSTVQLSTLKDTMVTMNNVSNVTIQGITFGTTCGKGISMMDCESCTIAGCTISRTGMRAMEIGSGDEESPESPDYFNLHGGHNNSVISCDIYATGMGGVFMAGGDRQTLTPGNNKVENCNFWDFSRIVRTSTPAINMGGCGNIARNNLIHNAPHFAIQFMGNDMLIENNEIYDVLQETGDSGVIYSGRDWSYRGNVIRYNYIHDIPTIGNIGTFAIYMDDCMSSTEVYGNIFCNLAGRTFMMGGGRDHKIYNNILINCGKGIAFDSRGLYGSYDNIPTQLKRLNNMPFKVGPWATRYPELAATGGDVNILKIPAGNVIKNNAYINTPDATMDQAVIDNSTIENNKHYSASDEVGFVDKANRDFNLKSDSVIFTDIPGFQSIPYNNIGLYADSYRTAANTIGEFNLISPEDGATNIEPTGFKPTWSVSDGAERYRLLVSKTSDFTDIVVDSYTSSNNAENISMILPENTTLYWKVEAGLNSDLWHVNRCSSTRSFTTSQAPEVLFSDGFENGLGNWIALSGFPSPSISSNQHHSGNNSLKISSDITVMSHTFDKSYNKIVTIWFYDDASKNGRYTEIVARADDGTKNISMGVGGGISTTKYMYRIGDVESATDITRTTGWHELKWDYTSGTEVDMYIDGNFVASSTVLTAFSKIAMGDYWSGGISNLYFDDVTVCDPDKTAPTVSDGIITRSNVTQTGATLGWSKATDDIGTQNTLQYLVYCSTSNNIDTVANIEANGTAIGDYMYDIDSKGVTGLTAGTAYYFNVIVKDEGGNKSCYSMTGVTTLAASEMVAPTVSDGTITNSNVTQAWEVTLSWNKATDNISAQSALQYVVYRSTSNNIDTVANIEANGTAIDDYMPDIASKEITGLTAWTTYYFNVIVKDEAGNKSCYNPVQIFYDSFENGLGNWTALTGTGIGLASISQDQHHSGAKSLKISSDVAVMYHRFDKSYNKIVTVWFYDNASKTSRYIAAVARVDDGSKCISMGVCGDNKNLTTKYWYRIGDFEKVTDIVRSTGWHELKWDYTSGTGVDMYIDGNKVASTTELTAYSYIAIGDYWGGYTSNLYFDDVAVRDPDTVAPTFADRTITSSNVTQTGITLGWSKATDDLSAQNTLQYLVYRSNSNNIDTVANIEANGTAIGDYMPDIAFMDITGLTAWTTYCFNVIVKDEAGNKSCCSMTSVTTLSALKTLSPVDGAAYLLNQEVLADWSVGDVGSGIASETGTAAKGTAIDTSSVGAKTFTVTVVDNTGMQISKTVSYNVVYAFGAVLPPVRGDNTKAFKAGSNIPVKFHLKDADNNFVTNAVARLYYAKIENGLPEHENEAVSPGSSNDGNAFRYDPADNQYVFNFKTNDWFAGTYQLRILLDDGISYTVVIDVN